MTKSVFITGTGTDIGKTYTSALIMKKLLQEKYNACYFKPVLSGAENIDGNLYAGDIEYVKKISGHNADTSLLGSYIFEDACSPHLASQKANTPILLDKIINDYNKLKEKYSYILSEGAGGIICPFSNDDNPIYTKDIIKTLNTNAVLVSTTNLGSINNAMLSIYYMQNHNINVQGIIFNGYTKSMIDDDNIDFILKHTNIPLLSVISHGESNIDIDIDKLFGE